MAIDKLPHHYSMTSPASVYDEEAVTAIELAGRTTGKVNEIIAAYNALETETGDKLAAQTAFIEKMNAVEMPAKVAVEVNAHIARGDFDKAINAYMGDLNARLSTLLGSVQEGTTTLDAEVIDGRVMDGLTHPSIGESMRMGFASLNRLMAFYKTTKTPIDTTLKMGYFLRNGTLKNDVVTNHYFAEIDVSGGEFYEITNYYGQDLPSACVKDSAGNHVMVYHTDANLVTKTNTIQIPFGGTKLYVNRVNNYGTFKVSKINGLYEVQDFNYFNNLAKNFNLSEFNAECVGEKIYNAIIQNGAYLTTSDTTNRFNLIKLPVRSGDIYRIMGEGYVGCHYYAFMNANGEYVYFSDVYNATGTKIDTLIVIPPNVTHLLISDIGNTSRVFLRGKWFNVDWGVKIYNAVLQGGKYLETSNQDNRFNLIKIPVVSGQTYRIVGRGYVNSHYYAFTNNNGEYIYFSDTYPTDETQIDVVVHVPNNAKWLIVTDLANYTVVYSVGGLSGGIWSGKKWCVVGDSLTEKNSRTTMNYHDYIASATGITVVNMGRSGTGYARTKDEGYAFYQRIANVPTNADVVTIFGSGNDMGAGLPLGTPTDTGTATLCGCINTTIDTLIGIMPAVQLGIVTPTPWVGCDPATDNAMRQYADAIVQICANRSIPCLDLYRCSNLRPWTEEGRAACYTKDDGNGVHPDETGHKIIAARFKGFLETLIV